MTVAQINVSKNGFYKGERLFISSSFIGKKSGKTILILKNADGEKEFFNEDEVTYITY